MDIERSLKSTTGFINEINSQKVTMTFTEVSLLKATSDNSIVFIFKKNP